MQAQVEGARLTEFRIRKDLARAIRTTGVSAAISPGISRYPDIAPSDLSESDGIRIIAEANGDFALPSHTSPDLVTIVKGEAPAGLYDYFSRFAAKGLMASLADSESRDVFEITNYSIEPTTKNLLINFKTSNSKIFGHGESLPSIQSLSEIYYVLNDKSQLIREERWRRDQDLKREVLAEKVNKLEIKYGFIDRKEVSNLILPTEVLSSPKEENYKASCVTGTCVQWKDISFVHLEIEFANPIENEEDEILSFKIYPSQFQLTDSGKGLVGSAFCRTDIGAHCKAEYSQCFTSDDRSSAKWKGYGDLGGAFCECGTDPQTGNYSPPELGPLNLQPWPAQQSRWNACMQSYDGCSEAFLRDSPIASVTCSCLWRGPTDYYKMNSITGYRSLNLPTSLSSIADAQSENFNDLNCYNWQNCDAAASQYYQSSSTLWADSCGCLTHFKGPQNEDWDWAPIGQWMLDWRRLCHLANSPTDCKNTSDDSGATYKLYAETNVQGLSPDNAIFCQCLKNSNILPTSEHPSPDWDFRNPNTLGIPTSSEFTDSRFGSISSKISTANTDSLGNITGACDLSYCNSLGSGLGCCTSAPDYENAESLLIEPYKGTGLNRYCRDSCRWDTGYAELGEIRKIITGAPDRWHLKIGCGGSLGDSSSGTTGGL